MEEELQKFKDEVSKENIIRFKNWEVISGDHLLKMDIPQSEFLIGNLIPLGGVTALSGNPGAGKSWLMLEIAKAISAIGFLFNQPQFIAKESRVLYVDEESSLPEIKRRWMMLNPPIFTMTDFISFGGFKIDNPQHRKDFLELACNNGYKLIIFDGLRAIHNKNENDSQQIQELVDGFREFTKVGITILVAHHNRKENFFHSKEASQTLRGSTAILAALDCLLSIESKRIDDKKIEYQITQSKLRQGKPVHPFIVHLTEENGKMIFSYEGEMKEEPTKVNQIKEAIINFLGEEEKSSGDIVNSLMALSFRKRTAIRALKELCDIDKKIKAREEGKRVFYSVSANVPDN